MSEFQAGMLACAVVVIAACLGAMIAVVRARRRSWDEFRARQDRALKGK